MRTVGVSLCPWGRGHSSEGNSAHKPLPVARVLEQRQTSTVHWFSIFKKEGLSL